MRGLSINQIETFRDNFKFDWLSDMNFDKKANIIIYIYNKKKLN